MSSSAMHIARTGLDAQDTRMRVISNNLANVNTTAFKRSRVSFEDVLYETVREGRVADAQSKETLAPVQIGVTPRRAWQVRADNGPTIELGREDIEPRLERFVGAYARTVGRLQRRIDHVDLRYSNGFAVRINELRGEPRSAAKAGKKG